MIAMIIECTLRSSILVAVVWLVLKALRVRNPWLERSAWRVVLAASVTMPLLMKLPGLPTAATPGLAWLQQVQLVTLPIASSVSSGPTVAFWIFCAIAAALLIRHCLGVFRWWTVRRAAQPISSPSFADSDIRVSAKVSSPATIFSTILVPKDFATWTAETQRLVIAHERTHVESNDFYVQWLAQVHRCVFWFNPLAWWMASRLSLLSEHISDDAAIAQAQEGADYAKLLLSFAHRAVRSDQLVAMARCTTLASRIERILAGARSARTGRWKTWLFVGALLPVTISIAVFQVASGRSYDRFKAALPSTQNLAATELPESAGSGANIVLPRSNPRIPLSAPGYPSASRRLGEHGTVILKLHVLEDGSVADAIIAKSSGYPDLDYAAYYEAFRWRLDPGTVDAAPSRMWGQFAVTFKLDD